MMKNYRVSKRYLVGITMDLISSIEPVCGVTRIGVKRYQQAALRGVPRKRLSLLIPDCGIDPIGLNLVEVGTKIGKYDGAERLQISIRQLPETTIKSMPDVQRLDETVLHVLYHGGCCSVVLCDADDFSGVRLTIYMGDTLRTRPLETAEGARQVIAWHWVHYYMHLSHNEVEDLLTTFEFLGCETLSEANRRASRALYARSREMGWRKLTSRERDKFGIEGGCWQRISTLDRLIYRQTGCGEFTHRAAHQEGCKND